MNRDKENNEFQFKELPLIITTSHILIVYIIAASLQNKQTRRRTYKTQQTTIITINNEARALFKLFIAWLFMNMNDKMNQDAITVCWFQTL